jgi:hypothetical protein
VVFSSNTLRLLIALVGTHRGFRPGLQEAPCADGLQLVFARTHGLLKYLDVVEKPASINHFDRRTLLDFARFLGSRWLAVNFCWEKSGLMLRLPPVGPQFLNSMASIFMPPISQNCSYIILNWDGTINAHCGEPDVQALLALNTAGIKVARELEYLVAEIVARRGRNFATEILQRRK